MKDINAAFTALQSQYTSLDPDESRKAKGSRDWLLDRIRDFEDEKFVRLSARFNMPFGSFARKTKIPELDDIDLMLGLDGVGCWYDPCAPWDEVQIHVGENREDLADLCHDGTNLLNSRKVVNQFVAKLTDVSHYSEAEIHRRGEACTLKLNSYDWKFDIVPCFFTKVDSQGRVYYIIPNADGHWMKTDPRIDKKRIERIDKGNGGNVVPIIRLIKYWYRQTGLPEMSSYLLETICLDYFEAQQNTDGIEFPDIYLPSLFRYIARSIISGVKDPKGLEPDINHTDDDLRERISEKAWEAYGLSSQARQAEKAGDMKGCFAAWGKIFGPLFPIYN